MRHSWVLAALAAVVVTGVVLCPPQVARGVEYTPVTVGQLEEDDSYGGSVWQLAQHPSTSLWPVQLIGVVVNKPADMLDYTLANTSYNGPQFQVFVQALSSGGTYGGYNVAPGDFGGVAVYESQIFRYAPDRSLSDFTDSEWTAETARIGASTLNVGDVVLVQAKTPGIFYNGKFNINTNHLKSPDNQFSITVLDHVAPSAPTIPLSALKNAANNFIFDSTRATGCEHYQGSLVHLDNLLLTDPSDWGLGKTVTVSQGTLTMPLQVGLDSALRLINPSTLATRPFSVTAIVDQEGGDYQAGYSLWMTSAAEMTPALLGDANLDNTVDDSDLNTVINHFGQTGQTWYTGDFTGDGIVNDNDLNTVINHYGQTQSMSGMSCGASVPEPSSFALLMTLAALGCGWTLRRRATLSLRIVFGATLASWRPAMNRFLILVAAVLLLGATVADADVLTVSGVRTTFNSSLDEIDIHLTGFDSGIPSDTRVNLLNGIWTATAASGTPGIYLGGTSFNWKGLTSNNNYAGQTSPQSYVNFNLTNDNATWSRALIDGTLYSSFQGELFTTNNDAKPRVVDPDLNDGFDQTLIAKMYVSTGAGITFAGNIGLSNRDPIYVGGFSVSSVPEPGTFVLLAVGALAGLLVWRRRA